LKRSELYSVCNRRRLWRLALVSVACSFSHYGALEVDMELPCWCPLPCYLESPVEVSHPCGLRARFRLWGTTGSSRFCSFRVSGSCELGHITASAHHSTTAGLSFLSGKGSWSCYRSHYRRCPLSGVADSASSMGFGGFSWLGIPRSRKYGLQCSRRNPFRIF
jgi:hypothetical protein